MAKKTIITTEYKYGPTGALRRKVETHEESDPPTVTVEAKLADGQLQIPRPVVHSSAPLRRRPPVVTPFWDADRLQEAKQALIDSGYFGEYEVGDDIAARITELVTRVQQATAAELGDTANAEHTDRPATMHSPLTRGPVWGGVDPSAGSR